MIRSPRVSLATSLSVVMLGSAAWHAWAAPAAKLPVRPLGHASPAPATENGPGAGLSLPPAIRLVSSDASGVTLRLDLDPWAASAPDESGRRLIAIRGLHVMESPGRPQLPYASTLIALPPGARVSASLATAGATETLDSLRIRITPRNGFEADPTGIRYHAVITPVPPIADGPWPTSDVRVGEPFELRGQRMAAVELHPFRYDESTGRLTARRSMIVRVTFQGGVAARPGAAVAPAAGPDRFMEPVLKSALLNYDQGRAFRTARALPAAGR